MSRFMLNRQVHVPPAYAERSCVLVSYRLPFLRHCFVLCHEPTPASAGYPVAELLVFFLSEAERLAQEAVGDSQAFVLIHSGQSIRKRASWHLHVFVIQRRWQKAWLYCVLGFKNVALVSYTSVAKNVRRLFTRPSKKPR
jgi:hypothetical protein